ncbi:DUF3450 family protein [Planctomycetales bacterium ZRK34]|nr:DUF3450 family protein [Planctomycetales bacterium ZRK34]
MIARPAYKLLQYAVVACLSLNAPAFAQSDKTAPTIESLRQQVAELDRELTAERELSQKLTAAHEHEIKTLRQRRADQAAKALQTQIKLEQTRAAVADLLPQINTLDQQADTLTHTADELRASLAAVAERVRISLEELPATEDMTAALARAVDTLRDPEALTSKTAADAIKVITEQLDLAHDRATRIAVRKVAVFTADGIQRPVRLLSIGHVRFAYITDEGDRVGLALASPTDASGYRWTESIPAAAAEQVRHAVEAVEAGQTDTLLMPMDPTGRLAPDTLNQHVTLQQRFVAGGPVMIPIAIVAALALLLILERVMVLYGLNRGSGMLARRVANECHAMQYDQASTRCQRSGGAVGRVLGACLLRRDRGQRAMEDSIQEQLLQELPRLGRFMGGIAILAAVAPLLGLLGTVTGIIQTFGVIRAFGNANPSLMAGGISEALITTAAGLIIAIPILIAHSLLRGRADRIIADAERHAASLLTLLAHDQPQDNSAAAASQETPDE